MFLKTRATIQGGRDSWRRGGGKPSQQPCDN